MPKTFANRGLLKTTYRSDAQPIIPPDLRRKAAQAGEFKRYAY
jgi:hypothetical protein